MESASCATSNSILSTVPKIKRRLNSTELTTRTDRIMPRDGLQSWIQVQIVLTLRSGNHVEMVTVEVLLWGFPSRIAIIKTLDTTITR